MSNASPVRHLRVLAFDALDWPLLQLGVDAGALPAFARLIETGACGPLHEPPPTHAASRWSTLATGLGAERHGVLAPFEPGPDGCSGRTVTRASLRARPFWELAAAADPATAPRVLNWPATDAPQPPAGGGWVIAPGAHEAGLAPPDGWGLHPEAAWPSAARDAVHAARLHPDELDPAAVKALLQGLPDAVHERLTADTRRQLAALATLQALALPMAAAPDSRLAVLRFDTLAAVSATAAAAALRPSPTAASPQALPPPWAVLSAWLRFVDALLASHLAALGSDDALLLIGSGTLPAELQMQRQDQVTAGSGAFVLLHGPGAGADRLIEGAQATDIAPTVLAWLGLPPPPGARGRSLLAAAPASTAVSRPTPLAPLPATPLATPQASDGPAVVQLDSLLGTPADALDEGHAWLAAHGVAPAPLFDFGRQVRALQCLGLGEALLATRRPSDQADAQAALFEALTLSTSAPAPAPSPAASTAPGEATPHVGAAWRPALLALAQLALQRQDAALAERLWPIARPWLAQWPELRRLCDAQRALLAADWSAAAEGFAALAAQRSRLANAPLWLAQALEGAGRMEEAEAALRRGLSWPVQAAECRAALARRLAGSGRPAEAVQVWSTALALQPSDPRWHLGRARALAATGAWEPAIAACERVLQLDPGCIEARAEWARLQRARLLGAGMQAAEKG